MIDFKGVYYPKDVILYAVFFSVRYAVSYREHLQNETLVGIETAHMIRKGQLYDAAFFKTLVAFTGSMQPDREPFLHDQDSTSLHLQAASL